MSQQLYTDNPNQDYITTQTSDTVNDLDDNEVDIELTKKRVKAPAPILGSSKINDKTGIITRAPKSKEVGNLPLLSNGKHQITVPTVL
ncbi:unnamed protein product [[Candida] boidinii]|nr:unnamed protein product [[Candida] boidinii]